ncbi:hypothetical protein TRFO_23785 [Tritrichomonas foetus]|uniref:Uncharacterized protein n=1 Tax=Tritrichomonas foetus TaxID=1144522 RepID=A0A1J4K8L8_9EUKA|nr:hypothetical protein TRFO_23785 [Tritrichomonas foetus]|eukprot:OHT07841.1 hypothetical protein TRFO_23785 [Tritrichomonas foetus]
MEQLFNQINSLTKQSRLIPAEEVITRVLLPFEETVPTKLSDSEIEKYEKILLGLLHVNSGSLSFQCSIRIAKCLLHLYSMQKPPKLWNIFTDVTKKTTTTGVLVIGFVIDQIGEHSRSMIPGLVKILFNQSDLFSTLFTLNASFKKDFTDIKSYTDKAFNLIRKVMSTKDEPSHLLAIQLLVSIYPTEVVPHKKFILLLKEIFNNTTYTAFVVDHLCYFIAFCAYYPLRDKQKSSTKINDWSVGASKSEKENVSLFESSFELLLMFKSHFSSILRHFLDFLSPNFIFDNLSILFNFVRKNQPSEISQLLSLFGRDARGELFKEIASEQPPSVQQQRILHSLSFDEATNNEIAALSLQLTSSSSSDVRLCGASYFALLAEKNPASAETYLNMSILYLAFPPEDNPTLDKDIFGMALIASHIIGASAAKRRRKLIEMAKNNINVFLSHAYECQNVLSSEFTSVFMLLSVLPPPFVNIEKCVKMLKLFNDAFGGSYQSHKQILTCSQYIASFLVTHPQIEGNARFLDLLAQNKSAQSYTSTLCAIIASTEACLVSNIAQNYLIPQILTITPTRQNVLSKLIAPMLNAQELLHYTKVDMPNMDLLYCKITDSYFAYRTVEFFPNLILSLDETTASRILVDLLTNLSNILMSHLLLLSLLKNVATQPYIPQNLNQFVLPLLEDDFNDILRLQVTAECAAIWTTLNDNALHETLTFISSKQGIGKCFVLASLFHYIQLNDSTIISVLHDIGELTKLSNICPYALFALSTLFSTHSLRLSTLAVADMQFPFLLSLVHTKLSLSPFNLYFISHAFIKLLPIISPEIKGSIAEPYVRLLIQSFCSTPLPFAPQIMFHTLRAVFAFAKDFADIKEMVFPRGPGTSTSFQIAACGAFADMMKVCNDQTAQSNNEFFELVSELLILLQKRFDSRVVDFIQVIAIKLSQKNIKNSTSNSEKEGEDIKQQVIEWARILKSVLTNNSLPNLQIESSIHVKRVCSLISPFILSALVKIEPLMNECLDDLMTSSTRAIETEDEEIMTHSYKFLCDVINYLKDSKTETGLPLLELYDSQFAIAIRHGFIDDLKVTGEFLVKYLVLHTQNLIKSPEKFSSVLNGYVDGLTKCEENSDYYYDLVSKICNIARFNETVFHKIENLLTKFESETSVLINESISVLSNDDPISISKFRANKSPYYSGILVSYIWLHSILKINDDEKKQKLLEFLSKEIQNNTEEWRTTAAVEAITCFFNYSKANSDLISKAVSAIISLKQKNEILYRDILPRFLASITKQELKQGSAIWNEIINLSFEDDSFDCKTIALLLGKNPPKIDVDKLIQKIYTFGKSDSQTMALLTILIKISWKLQLSLILTSKFENSFKMKLITRILKTVESVDDFLTPLSIAFFKMFKKGGMNDLASIAIANPKIAYDILNVDKFKRICDLCENDVQNSPVFLQFLLLILEKCQIEEDTLHILMQQAMKIITISGNNPQKGREIVDHCIRIILKIQTKAEIMRKVFAELSQREQQILLQLTEKQADKVKSRQNAINLKQFSTKPKKAAGNSSDEDEWETLEIGD